MRPASIAADGDLLEHRGGCGFHHDVGLRQVRQRDQARPGAEVAQMGLRLRLIARRDGDQAQPVHASIECPRQLQADRAETADRDRLHHVSSSAIAHVAAGVPLCQREINLAPGPVTGENQSSNVVSHPTQHIATSCGLRGHIANRRATAKICFTEAPNACRRRACDRCDFSRAGCTRGPLDPLPVV